MKNSALTAMLTLGFAALLGTAPANAQVRQIATIPFSFEAGGVEYSEGIYSIERLSQPAKVVKIMNLTNGRAVVINAPVSSGADTRTASKLVFRQTGDRMKLGEIWFAGYPGMLTLNVNKDVSAKVVVPLK